MTSEARIDIRRGRLLRLAIQVEVGSLAWIVIETVLSAIAATAVGSLAISTFSVDSGVELLSGFVLLVRLFIEHLTGRDQLSQAAERVAAAVVGLCLVALAAFISFKSGQALALKKPVEISYLGLMVAVLSSLITPWLARAKHQLGEHLNSHALLGDAACSMTCAYMAWTLLVGMFLQWVFGWWWIDPVAALGILYFVVREALESLSSAVTGETHAHSH